jgi:hypothetical protein
MSQNKKNIESTEVAKDDIKEEILKELNQKL